MTNKGKPTKELPLAAANAIRGQLRGMFGKDYPDVAIRVISVGLINARLTYRIEVETSVITNSGGHDTIYMEIISPGNGNFEVDPDTIVVFD